MPINRSEPDGLEGSGPPRASPRGHSSDARYHVFGTRTARCISLATSGAPSVVRRPEMTQLLLPTASLSGPAVPPEAQSPEPKVHGAEPKADGSDVSCRGGFS